MAKLVKKSPSQEPDFLPHTLRAATLAAEHKAVDLKAYDVRGLTVIADSFVMCSATSEPHLKAIYSAVREGMREAGVRLLHTEGGLSGNWLVLDYGSVVFHIFRREAREFYDLDALWADAPEVDVSQ